jgi:spoIIIJ-associated protein
MDVSLDEQGEVAEDFLAGLVEAFGLRASISAAKLDDETLELSLEGEDLTILIGARGATLQAIQDLTRTVVQRQTKAAHGRLLVDVLDYRKKRRVALERFARELAEEVRTAGQRRVLEPMGAADRKVVHDVINTLDGVTTTSEGEEPHRRVVILPSES